MKTNTLKMPVRSLRYSARKPMKRIAGLYGTPADVLTTEEAMKASFLSFNVSPFGDGLRYFRHGGTIWSVREMTPDFTKAVQVKDFAARLTWEQLEEICRAFGKNESAQ